MKYLPNWFELNVWEASDFKSMTPTLHFYCRSGQVDEMKAALSELQKKQQTIRGRIEEKQGTPHENQDMLEYNKEKLGEIKCKLKDSTNISTQLSERVCAEGDYQQGQLMTLIPFGHAQASFIKVAECFPNFKSLQELTVHYLNDFLLMEGNERV